MSQPRPNPDMANAEPIIIKPGRILGNGSPCFSLDERPVACWPDETVAGNSVGRMTPPPAIVAASATLIGALMKRWSERRDSNPRPPVPQTDALPDCATLRRRRCSSRFPPPQRRTGQCGSRRRMASSSSRVWRSKARSWVASWAAKSGRRRRAEETRGSTPGIGSMGADPSSP